MSATRTGTLDAAVVEAFARTPIPALMAAYAPRRRIGTVAVVGNAPLEPSPERAALVDDADLVVRVNGFALDGAVPTLGRRADVVVFNRGIRATPWEFDGYRERLYLLVEPGRMHWEPSTIPPWWPPDLGFATVPNREVIVPLARALGLDAERDGLWGTTGTTAAWIARTAFPTAELRLTGFSFIEKPEQTAWEHAYGDACAVGPEHRIGPEGALLRSWAEAGLARLLA